MDLVYPKFVAGFVPIFLALCVFAQGWFTSRQKYLLLWSIACCCYLARIVISAVLAHKWIALDPVVVVYGVLAFTGAYFLNWGNADLAQKRPPGYLPVLSLFLSILWIMGIKAININLFWEVLPGCMIIGFLYIKAGRILNSSQIHKTILRGNCIVWFYIWGFLQAFATPVMSAFYPQLMPYQVMTGAILEGFAAILLITLYFQQNQILLLNKKEKAQQDLLAKDIFLAKLSHELKTPMTGLLGLLDLSLREKLSLQHKQHLHLTKSLTKSKLFLLNGLLEQAQVKQGKPKPLNSIFSSREVLEQVLEASGIFALENQIYLTGKVTLKNSEMLKGDKNKLTQIFLHLTLKAMAQSPNGEIFVCISLKHATDQNNMIIFSAEKIPNQKSWPNFSFSDKAMNQRKNKMEKTGQPDGLDDLTFNALVSLLNGRTFKKKKTDDTFRYVFEAPIKVINGGVKRSFQKCSKLNTKVLICAPNALYRKTLFNIFQQKENLPVLVSHLDQAQKAFARAEQNKQPFGLIILVADFDQTQISKTKEDLFCGFTQAKIMVLSYPGQPHPMSNPDAWQALPLIQSEFEKNIGQVMGTAI